VKTQNTYYIMLTRRWKANLTSHLTVCCSRCLHFPILLPFLRWTDYFHSIREHGLRWTRASYVSYRHYFLRLSLLRWTGCIIFMSWVKTDGRELFYVVYCGCHIVVVIIFATLRRARRSSSHWVLVWSFISNQMPGTVPTQPHLTGKVDKESEPTSC